MAAHPGPELRESVEDDFDWEVVLRAGKTSHTLKGRWRSWKDIAVDADNVAIPFLKLQGAIEGNSNVLVNPNIPARLGVYELRIVQRFKPDWIDLSTPLEIAFPFFVGSTSEISKRVCEHVVVKKSSKEGAIRKLWDFVGSFQNLKGIMENVQTPWRVQTRYTEIETKSMAIAAELACQLQFDYAGCSKQNDGCRYSREDSALPLIVCVGRMMEHFLELAKTLFEFLHKLASPSASPSARPFTLSPHVEDYFNQIRGILTQLAAMAERTHAPPVTHTVKRAVDEIRQFLLKERLGERLSCPAIDERIADTFAIAAS